MPKDSPIVEKMLIIGCDSKNIVQDMFWISSDEEDIKWIGSVATQLNNDISSKYGIAEFSQSRTLLMSGNNVINSLAVDEIIDKYTDKTNIKTILDKIGLPTARGFKQVGTDKPMHVASWTHSTSKVGNRKQSFVPYESLDGGSDEYLTIEMRQTRFIVMYDDMGNIHEIMWIKPYEKVLSYNTPSSIVVN